MLYRAFPWRTEVGHSDPGGALHVPRILQGGNRHDNPRRYGTLYASRNASSAVAERLRAFRRREVSERDLVRPDGPRYALAAIDDSGLSRLVDLDDPKDMDARGLRPSRIATRNRRTTRRLALAIFEEGTEGFEWWSTIEASWINVTLFAERAAPRLSLVAEPEPLTLAHPAVRDAADALGVRLSQGALG